MSQSERPAERLTPWRVNGHELYFGGSHGQISTEHFATALADAHNREIGALRAENAELREQAVRQIKETKAVGDFVIAEVRERLSKAEADAAAANDSLGKLKQYIQNHQEWYPFDEVGKEHFVHALMQTYIDRIDAVLSGQAGESILAVVRAAEDLVRHYDEDRSLFGALRAAVERMHSLPQG